MQIQRPAGVTVSHLAAGAAVYVRQSTEKQTIENTGSLDYQRGQMKWPMSWGWPAEAIRRYEDLGLSGAGTEHRPGFLELAQDIREGRVRALFASDQSRLARNAVEWIKFLELCKAHECLIVLDGRIIHLGDSGDGFASQIMALVDEFENEKRLAHFRRGTLAKVEAGKAVSTPPTGYITVAGGQWEQHPDPAVGAAITAVFRIFLEERSCIRTVQRMRSEGCQIPRQFPGKALRWVDANRGAVLTILKNPVYCGDYIFRRRVVDRARGKNSWGQHRVRVARRDEQKIVRDHHPAYISREEWVDVCAILERNAPSKIRRNLGPGSALLQGILRCAQHGDRALGVDYKWPRRDGTNAHYYHCLGLYDVGGPQCGAVPGRPLDVAVAAAVFRRMGPPEIRMIRAEWEQARKSDLIGHKGRGLALDQATRRVDDLRARYYSVNPELRDLAEDIDVQLNAAIGVVKELKAAAAVEPELDSVFTEDAFEEMVGLVSDLPGLFYAVTTEHRDRKEILRMLVDRVEYLGRTPEVLRARIIWSDGSEPSEVEGRLHRYAHRRILEFAAQGLKNSAIAKALNDAGLETSRGKPWTMNTVWQARRRGER
jgi:DNA invertase Pin-like site-specific DNA recombinase